MKALQSKDWSAPATFEASYITVTVAEPEVTHQVSVRKFNDWLERTHGSPRDTIQRQKVKSILNG
jgi:hypothetical protein